MAVVFEKPKTLTDATLHYCPGCTHGIIHTLVAQAIEELGIEGKTVGVAPVGCEVMAYNYFTCDLVEMCIRDRQGQQGALSTYTNNHDTFCCHLPHLLRPNGMERAK